MKTADEIILAVDTSGRQGSVALARAAPDFRVLEVAPLAGGSYSSQLMPQIAALLARHQILKQALTGLAAASGPGSFTGLRVGLSAIKALAEVLRVPIAAVSVLQAVAAQAPAAGPVLALLDGGRKQVFAGVYEQHTESVPECRRELLLTQDEVPAAVRGAGVSQVLTPDGAIASLLTQSGFKARQVEWPDAGVIARLGWLKMRRGDTVAAETLDANYIRRSDAEIFAK